MSSINDNAGGESKNNVVQKRTALKMEEFPDRKSNEISFSEDGESLGNIDSKKMIKEMEGISKLVDLMKNSVHSNIQNIFSSKDFLNVANIIGSYSIPDYGSAIKGLSIPDYGSAIRGINIPDYGSAIKGINIPDYGSAIRGLNIPDYSRLIEAITIPDYSNLINAFDIVNSIKISKALQTSTALYNVLEGVSGFSERITNVIGHYGRLQDFVLNFPLEKNTAQYKAWVKKIAVDFNLQEEEVPSYIFSEFQESGYYLSVELLENFSRNELIEKCDFENFSDLKTIVKKELYFYMNCDLSALLMGKCDLEIIYRLENVVKQFNERNYYAATLLMIETNGRLVYLKTSGDLDAYKFKKNQKIISMVKESQKIKLNSINNNMFSAYWHGYKESVINRQVKNTKENGGTGRHHVAHGHTKLDEYNEDLFLQHLSYFLYILDLEKNS